MLNLRPLIDYLRHLKYKIGTNTHIIFLSINLHNIYYQYAPKR